MLLVLKVYETCDLTVCPARYIFFNFMYILYLNFRKISNFQAYTSQPHSLSLSLHNPQLKNLKVRPCLLREHCQDQSYQTVRTSDHPIIRFVQHLAIVNQLCAGFIISIILLFAYVSLVLFSLLWVSNLVPGALPGFITENPNRRPGCARLDSNQRSSAYGADEMTTSLLRNI